MTNRISIDRQEVIAVLCYYCMKETGNDGICPYCGHDANWTTEPHQLLPGTKLANRYVIGRVLGEGGFGITYIGFDTTLRSRVAVKEFYPFGIVNRNNERSCEISVSSSGDKSDLFTKGITRFLEEARNLARFTNEPGIVNVSDFFEANHTAYIVMEYLEGITLRDYLHQNGVIRPDEAFTMLRPVVKSLEAIHAEGVIHRDISPDNIMVLNSGQLKLMDFGAARVYDDENCSMSVMLKKGYAPEEQYRRNGDQGPWTDVYGLCATIYRCITGKTPDDSLDRVHHDQLLPPSRLGVAIAPELENVLMYGLALYPQNRCKSMTELMQLTDNAFSNASVPAQSAPAPFAAPDSFQPDESTMLADDQGTGNDPQNRYQSTAPAENKGMQGGSHASGTDKPVWYKKKAVWIIASAALLCIVVIVIVIVVLTSNSSVSYVKDSAASSQSVREISEKPTEKSAVKATEKPTEKATEKPTEKPATKPTMKPTEPPAPTEEPSNKYTAGQYKVGVDIPAGLYAAYTEGDSKGYYCISSDANGGNILANNNFSNQNYLQIEDGQYLELSRCYVMAFDDAPLYDYSSGVVGDGQYLVGVDIPAGEYTLKAAANSKGYYCVSSDPNGRNILANNNFSGNNYVTVADGQYLELSRCELYI